MMMDNQNRQNDSASSVRGTATPQVYKVESRMEEGDSHHVSGRASTTYKDPVEYTDAENIPVYCRPHFGDHGEAHDTHNPCSAPQETVKPLKREVIVSKEPVEDFGTSLCLLHGDIYVTDVRETSPAWRAGLQPGDRIEAIDDVQIRPDEFHRRRVMPQKILQYLRSHDHLEIKVCDQPVTRPRTVHARHYAEDNLGIEYHNSVVTKVDKESAADMGGIMTGESILEVNDAMVVGKSDEEVLAIIEQLRMRGDVELKTVPAELALEMVWAQAMISSRTGESKQHKRAGSFGRRSYSHASLLGN